MDRLFDTIDHFFDHYAGKVMVILLVLSTAIIIGAGVVRAQKGQSLISYEQVAIDNGFEITAEDAMEGMGEYRWGKLIVSKGQDIVIESKLEEAGIQVCVNRYGVDYFDKTVEGKQSIVVKVEPGTYSVGTYPKDGATGTVTITTR